MTADQFFEDLLQTLLKESASDLHLTVGRRPTLRIAGNLIELAKHPTLTPAAVKDIVFIMLNEAERERYLAEREFDFSYAYKDKARFRANVFFQRGYMGAALRYIPAKIRDFNELNLPPILSTLCERPQGFVLVVGPTGHGKTTTLAAMVDYINRTRTDHVITIEDPIEYLFTSDRAIVDQREVGADTKGFHQALRSMFREDVDVAMIGEMRDADTIGAAVTAAETGHLILSSLHTNNAAQTIDRIIDSFPGHQQGQIRQQLAATLVAIVSQRLIPRISGGLIPAVEVLIGTPAVRTLVREGKVHELDLVIETNSDLGMQSLNRSLVDLVRRGEIAMDQAAAYSLNPDELSVLLRG
ncbi:MAG: type IV pili twitching motility protein PilT [Candidatus Sungbacteria bacterium RIFCSPLOWO2_01_FULL_59_16]|uniref:Type IV pili twitching motility protein PilT n=1 Tax=Candidatus Sungbacteria bacterium RIFCSPLOWO2_01_FULL_59_16 TaxID=1802280 RepID=A0A1G2L9U0_9BACT|nr:MAG: type IV pili twitching motility protein PilT [Candidatus Sungbacteria bacterium RIFCSPLOWO2_01_FULL_59_16]